MRTQEQIDADLEKRFAEIEAEYERRKVDPTIQRPCKTCRHVSTKGNDDFEWGPQWNKGYEEYYTCCEPLVRGFGQAPRINTLPAPCGPEKALWQPKQTKLTFWQKLIQFFTHPQNKEL